MRCHGTIFVACLVAIGAFACGSNRKEVESAKHSLYDTDFAVVYSAALEATRDLYPNLDDNPGPGKIQTSWHQVQYSNCAGAGSTCDDVVNPQVIAQQQGVNANATPGAQMAGTPTRLAYKRYFIRFDVHVMGGRPWRVKVKGHASSWDPGAAMPVELKGADKPHWLDGRTEALQVAIWKKIRQFAIPMKEDPADATTGPEETHAGPATDPSTFKNVPPLAAKELAAVKDALARRDYGALKPLLADDVVWSLGGGTGAEAAMAMWQADPTAFDAMAGTLGACVTEAEGKRVACPGGHPAANAYQLVIEPRGEAWRVTSFVKAE